MDLKFLSSFVLVILCSSCSYHFVDSSRSYSFNILPIKGDQDSLLLSSLTAEIMKNSQFIYSAFNSQYDVEIIFKQLDTDHVDYQYQTEAVSNEIINRLSPVEGEHDLIVSFSLTNKNNRKKVLGPIEFRQIVNYDFSDYRSYNDLTFIDLQGQSQTVLNYSLGQLAAEDDARASAKVAAYKAIAKKIAAYLSANLL